MAVDQWRHYLLQNEFVIHTDHRSLVHLNEQRLHTPWQQKAFTKLLGLNYRIQYRRGVENCVADALSRRVHQTEVFALSSPVHDWLLELQQWYAKDEEAQTLLAKLALQPEDSSPFSLRDGIIRFKQRIWLGSNKVFQTRVMVALHNSPIGGHSGAPVTLQKLRQLFYWPSMRADVLQFVQSCVTCAQAKPDRSKYPGLLQPLPVPKASWEVISMDFVEGLPCSGSANAILVVVDKFSKFAHFVPLRHPFTAESVAKLFLDNIYRLHGLPLSMISDRDRVFTRSFGRPCFVWLVFSCVSAQRTIHRRTARRNVLISVWKPICVALCTLACAVGFIGCLLQNFGIIPALTLLLGVLRLRCFMAVLLATWVWIYLQLLKFHL